MVHQAVGGESVRESAEQSEIDILKVRLSDEGAELEAGADRKKIAELVTIALDIASGSNEKGKALEEFGSYIFASAKGVSIIKRDARLAAEEIDLIIRNNASIGFWRHAGPVIAVECKNWSSRVGAKEISVFAANLATLGPDAKTGILIAPNGISGDSYSDAVLKIREQRMAGKNILVIERADLESLANGEYLTDLLERKHGELYLR